MAGELEEIPTKTCLLCKQDVPVANFEMHSAHCKRFLTCCPHCQESVNKNHLDEHINEYHVKIKCDDCGECLEKMELEAHKETSCKRRSLKCEYCELSLPASDIDEHKEACGSRTEQCEKCQKRILFKDLEEHILIGCQPPDVTAESSSKPSVGIKTRKPEKLYQDNPRETRQVLTGTGFPVCQQFLGSKYIKQNDRSPLFGSYSDHEYDALQNGYVDESAFADPTSFVSPVDGPFMSFISRSDKKTTTFHETNPRNENHPAGSYDEKSRKSKSDLNAHSNSKQPFDLQELPAYGIPDSDSDPDDMSTEEKKAFPDLADDTFLPCEFCEVLLPADAICMHQANCDKMSPTPRPENPRAASFNPRAASFNPRAASFNPRGPLEPTTFPPTVKKQDSNSSLLEQASGVTFNDIDEGSAPCEFCSASFPLSEVACHQIKCSENPNLERFRSSSPPEPRRALTPPPASKSHPLKSETEHPASVLASQAKPSPIKDTNVSLTRRDKRGLAPTFLNGASASPQVNASTGAKPKTKTSPVDNSATEKKISIPKGNGRHANGRSVPIVSTNVSRTFHEVNVLGGDPGVSVDPKYSTDMRKLATNNKHSKDRRVKKSSSSRFNGEGAKACEGSTSFFQAVPNSVNEGKVPCRDYGSGTGKGRELSNSGQRTNQTRFRNTRSNKPSGLQFDGAGSDIHDNPYDRHHGNAGAQNSYARTRVGQIPRGQSYGSRTITVSKRGSSPRKAFGSTQQRGRGGLNEHGQDRRRPSANESEENFDENSSWRPVGYRLGAGKGGSRGGRTRNARSPRQPRH